MSTTQVAKHTPGPWHVKQLANYVDKFEIRGPHESGVMVARTVEWGVAADDPDPSWANARLIAAAPDLLECLQNAAMNCTGERRARYLAAIAKATGEA